MFRSALRRKNAENDEKKFVLVVTTVSFTFATFTSDAIEVVAERSGVTDDAAKISLLFLRRFVDFVLEEEEKQPSNFVSPR